VAAIVVGYRLDLIDKQIDATGHLTSGIRSLGKSLEEAAEYLEKTMPKDYQGYPVMFMQ